MHRIILAIAVAVALFIPGVATGVEVGAKGNGLSYCDEQYIALYKEADNLGHPLGKSAVEKGVNDKQICRQVDKLRAVVEAARVPLSVETTTPEVEAPAYDSGVGSATVMCESGGDYSINTGNGYYGGYQFDSQTWDAYGDPAYSEAHLAPPAVQDAAAAAVPYDAWPNC